MIMKCIVSVVQKSQDNVKIWPSMPNQCTMAYIFWQFFPRNFQAFRWFFIHLIWMNGNYAVNNQRSSQDLMIFYILYFYILIMLIKHLTFLYQPTNQEVGNYIWVNQRGLMKYQKTTNYTFCNHLHQLTFHRMEIKPNRVKIILE